MTSARETLATLSDVDGDDFEEHTTCEKIDQKIDEAIAKLHVQCGKIPLADLRTAISVHRANCRQPICPVLVVMEANEATRSGTS